MADSPDVDQEELSKEEALKRRDEVLKRMLNTPPKPRPAKIPKANCLRDGDYFLAIDGKLRIAHATGSTTVDLYRNLGDYRDGKVMERGFTFRPA